MFLVVLFDSDLAPVVKFEVLGQLDVVLDDISVAQQV